MSVNNIDHEFCSVCGESLEFVRTEKDKTSRRTLMYYACPKAQTWNNHDRAVYEIDMSDVEIA